MKRIISQDQAFAALCKSLARVGVNMSVEQIKKNPALKQEVFSDMAVMGKVPVLHGCSLTVKHVGAVRQWCIEGNENSVNIVLG